MFAREEMSMDIDSTAADGPVGGSRSELIKDSSAATFMADVVEASTTTPVIVDFWAAWCGPCKQLGPVLEKVVTEAGGAVKLVKVDIDENPEIAQQLRVQSIPAVFAFKNGQPVDGFAGALPESQIREFVKKLTGGAAGESPVAEELEAAESFLNEKNYDAAIALFKQILQHDPSSGRGLAGLCKTLIALNRLDEAKEVVDKLSEEQKKEQEIKSALSQLDLALASGDTGNLTELKLSVEADPKNLEARFDLAMALYASGDSEGAVDHLLESIAINRGWNDEAARKQLVKLFGAFGQTDPLTIEARKRLSSILFS